MAKTYNIDPLRAMATYLRSLRLGERLPAFDYESELIYCARRNVTLAQLNAGHVLVKGVPGHIIHPVDFLVRFNGTFTTSTDIRISDTAGTPVELVTIAIAQAGDGVLHRAGVGTHTLGAAFNTGFTEGLPVRLRQTGTAAAGGTSVRVSLLYKLLRT